jgi:N4-gp56 family major capsid protein
MANTTPSANNKLVQYRKELIREYVRENMFSPYMGSDINAIIRTIYDNKKGGEQVNIPLVTKLTGTAKSAGTLTGQEEAINNYGMRAWVDWARHAVATTDADEQKDSADIFGEAKPLLSDWGKELQRDEIIEAFMSLPSESAPSGLGSSGGQRVNGITYAAATTVQLNAWAVDNSDRVLYGNAVGNYSGVHATDLGKIDASADKFTKASVSLMKRVAKLANPRIRPYKTKDGYEYYVAFAPTTCFRDLKTDMGTVHSDALPRSKDNIIFQAGDLMYDGVIIREVPEIDSFVTDIWTSSIDGNLKTGGDSSGRVAPVFLCGQSALAMPWAKMPTPTFRDETDYQFIKGVGVKMCYGVAKVFQKDSNSDLTQWGVVNGFFSAPADA